MIDLRSFPPWRTFIFLCALISKTQKSDQDRDARWGAAYTYRRVVRDQSESSEHDSCCSHESVSLRRWGVRVAIYRAWESNGPEIVVSAFARLSACGDTYAIMLREHISAYIFSFFFFLFFFLSRKNLLHGFTGTLLHYRSCFVSTRKRECVLCVSICVCTLLTD